MGYLFVLLKQRWVLGILFIINFFGTIYGYYWYRFQLADTPAIFLPFVPDSPTASLFFTVVLFGFLIGKQWPLIEALAVVTLIKYGLWAVGMNIAGGFVGSPLTVANYMLIFSHLGMAVQAVLYRPFYHIRVRHLIIVTIWILHNDVIDYVFGMLPRYPALAGYENIIGYLTFWLSIATIAFVYIAFVKPAQEN